MFGNGSGSSHPYLPLDCLKRWQSDHTCHHLDRFSELATKSGMGSPDRNVLMVDIHLRNLLWVSCPGHAGVMGNDRKDTTGGQSNHVGTKPRTSHHRLPRGERRGKKALDDLPWKDERGPSSITNTKTVSKATLGKLLRNRVGRKWAFRGHRYHLQLNWTGTVFEPVRTFVF